MIFADFANFIIKKGRYLPPMLWGKAKKKDYYFKTNNNNNGVQRCV